MALELPSVYYAGFRDLATLDSVQFEALASALERKSPTLFSSSTDLLASPVEGVEDRTIVRILDAFIGLAYGAMDNVEKSPAETAGLIARQVLNSNNEPLNEVQRDTIEARVRRIIEINSFRVSVRAFALALANGRNFISGRVITDLRPVFDSSTSIGFENVLVLHRLQIQCTSAEANHEELIITLDSSDLKALTEQLKRAVDKESALKTALHETKMHFLSSLNVETP